MDPPFEQAAILGVGLIGGSLGLALRQRGLARRVVGYSRTASTRHLAVELGAIDLAAGSPVEAVAGADLVYLAVPVASIVPLLAEVAPRLAPGALVTDAGSSKAEICAGAATLELAGAEFVGGHPMAGSELLGVEHARADLFAGMAYAICPAEPAATARLHRLALALGAEVVELSPDEHDRAVALVSHLPHLLAAALMRLAATHRRRGEPVHELSAGSWASATRVAASGPTLWREVLASNRAAVLAVLDELGETVAELRAMLAGAQDDELEALLAAMRDEKRRHPGRGGG